MKARDMQIEFERRITLMNPALNIAEKVTSDTIFSFLNAYTKRYVRELYLSSDSTEDGTRAQKRSIDAIKSLLKREVINKTKNVHSDEYTESFLLPDDYFLYVRSNSLVTSTYRDRELSNTQAIPNHIIDADDTDNVLTTPFNHIILRNPQVILHTGGKEVYANVIHDQYTTLEQLDLIYYRLPKEFNVLNVDGKNILDHCELPESTHMEIVEGAVDMFVTEAKYRLNTKQDK